MLLVGTYAFMLVVQNQVGFPVASTITVNVVPGKLFAVSLGSPTTFTSPGSQNELTWTLSGSLAGTL